MEKTKSKVEQVIDTLEPELRKEIIVGQNITALIVNLLNTQISNTELAINKTGRLRFKNKQTLKRIKDLTYDFIIGVDREFNSETISEGFGSTTDDLYEIFEMLVFLNEDEMDAVKQVIKIYANK